MKAARLQTAQTADRRRLSHRWGVNAQRTAASSFSKLSPSRGDPWQAEERGRVRVTSCCVFSRCNTGLSQCCAAVLVHVSPRNWCAKGRESASAHVHFIFLPTKHSRVLARLHSLQARQSRRAGTAPSQSLATPCRGARGTRAGRRPSCRTRSQETRHMCSTADCTGSSCSHQGEGKNFHPSHIRPAAPISHNFNVESNSGCDL